jgi:hypothetical protein
VRWERWRAVGAERPDRDAVTGDRDRDGEREAVASADREERQGQGGGAGGEGAVVRLDVRLSCQLANVPAAATDAFKASADRVFNGALERVKELATAYADAVEPSRPPAMRAAVAIPWRPVPYARFPKPARASPRS